MPSADKRLFLVDAVLDSDPASERALATLHRIVALTASSSAADGTVVGGATAELRDTQNTIMGGLWKIILFILGLSYVVLLLLLRSVFLPLKAVLMNRCQRRRGLRRARRGVPVGLARRLLGFESLGYIDTMTPPLLLAIVFGLSMDYEVFLLSRIRKSATRDRRSNRRPRRGVGAQRRDDHERGADHGRGVRRLRRAGVPSIQEIGVGGGRGRARRDDRPARARARAMALLGDWNWWLPTGSTASCRRRRRKDERRLTEVSARDRRRGARAPREVATACRPRRAPLALALQSSLSIVRARSLSTPCSPDHRAVVPRPDAVVRVRSSHRTRGGGHRSTACPRRGVCHLRRG